MGQSGIRLGYFIERARSLRVGNLVEFARQSRRVTRKPVPVLIADMLWCSTRYELGFRDYAMWDFATLNRAERKTWMTHPKSHRLNVAVNDPAHRIWFSDKIHFYERFADLLGREWLDLRVADAETLADFVTRHDRAVVKPADGVGGGGVELIDLPRDGDFEELRRRLIESDQVLMDAVIDQDATMSALYPGAVNTVRLITYLAPDDRLHLLAAVLRIGNGAAVDNFASGGMFTLLDDDGTAPLPAVDKHGTVYDLHPVTGTRIAGFSVPGYDRLLALIEDAARRVPEVPYVGWDIAISAGGPVLIEGNHNSSVFQTPPSVSGVKTGLLPVYRAATGIDL